jgi:hypothetical protein
MFVKINVILHRTILNFINNFTNASNNVEKYVKTTNINVKKNVMKNVEIVMKKLLSSQKIAITAKLK